MQVRTRMLAMALLAGTTLLSPIGAQDDQTEGTPKQEAVPAVPLIRPGVAASQEPALSEFQKIEQEHDAAYEAWVSKVMAMSDEERSQGYPDPPTKSFFPRFMKLADQGDISAMAWVLNNYYYAELPPEGREELQLRMLKQLASHPENADAAEAVANALMYSSPLPVPVTIALLEGVISEAKDPGALAALHFSLAQVLMHQPDEASKKKAVEVLKILDTKYKDSFYGRFAKGLIYETENLQVGMLAPQFAGKDVHGEEIKLSDYRGKVTLLVFWGFW